jgi:NAD(P)-dependent dehydrogenase (short-subunit alcohol dehydrogenase family)
MSASSHTFERTHHHEPMRAGIDRILAEEGRIDVLVNNAGHGSYGAVEDVPMEEARRQFEVNVFGAARLTQLVLPHMRQQHSGTIVNITSMGGKISTRSRNDPACPIRRCHEYPNIASEYPAPPRHRTPARWRYRTTWTVVRCVWPAHLVREVVARRSSLSDQRATTERRLRGASGRSEISSATGGVPPSSTDRTALLLNFGRGFAWRE